LSSVFTTGVYIFSKTENSNMGENEGFARLRLITSPLLEPSNSSESSFERHGDVESNSKRRPRELTLTETEAENEVRLQDESLHRTPAFKRHEEATNIELFFDLFFVANLTIFSQNHELNSMNNLTSYIGFFCILWFTWLQVSMFDVRFVADSLFERVAKALHLGVMIGMYTSCRYLGQPMLQNAGGIVLMAKQADSDTFKGSPSSGKNLSPARSLNPIATLTTYKLLLRLLV
jgi:hypothetical protein